MYRTLRITVMAEIDHCPVILAGEGHVFGCGFPSLRRAEGAGDACVFVETDLFNESVNHFIAPDLVLGNDLFLEGD